MTKFMNISCYNAYYNRGSIYFKKGKQQEAISDFQRAARLGDKKAQEFLKSRGLAGGKIN
jgi:tetratricopeptide (TPR) repeat protein